MGIEHHTNDRRAQLDSIPPRTASSVPATPSNSPVETDISKLVHPGSAPRITDDVKRGSSSWLVQVGQGIVGKRIAPGVLQDAFGLHLVGTDIKELWRFTRQNRAAMVQLVSGTELKSKTPSTAAARVLCGLLKELIKDGVDSTSLRDRKQLNQLSQRISQLDLGRESRDEQWSHATVVQVDGIDVKLKVSRYRPNILERIAVRFNRDLSKSDKDNAHWLSVSIGSQPASFREWSVRCGAYAGMLATMLGGMLGTDLALVGLGAAPVAARAAGLAVVIVGTLGTIALKRRLAAKGEDQTSSF